MNQAAIEELKKQVRGEVLQSSDAGYGESRTIYNAMIDRRPAAIVFCSGTADAAAACDSRANTICRFRSAAAATT